MYDKYSERQFVNIGHNNFRSERYEVWSEGELVDTCITPTIVTFETISDISPLEDSILVAVESSISEKYLGKNFSFDVAYSNGDRILLGIIAKETNCQSFNDYQVFVMSAPFITRTKKIFKQNEPFACSIFMMSGQPDKITFTVPLSRCLVEFYSR